MNNQNKNKPSEEVPKKKRKKKVVLLIIIFLVVLVLGIFGTWYIIPKKHISVALLDKTILSYAEDNGISKDSAYRKHSGFFWILEHHKYTKLDGTFYDETKDYFGPMLNEDGAIDSVREANEIEGTPDLFYMADAYGVERIVDQPEGGGITADDMSVISYAYESGATIVTEMTMFSAPLSDSVYSQLSNLCGVTPTGWLGRYIFDLQDFTDVPVWARPMYEQQEGVEWRFTGPGILLVSRDGKILILEQNTDFHSKNLLKIYMNDEYKSEFSSCKKCYFYNWFELVEPNYGTESIATFEFDLNAVGMEKIREVSKIPRFTAVTRKVTEDHAPVYYFAGDFNDYTSGKRYGRFIFADRLYKFLSYDRQADITNFFWCFYEPLMRDILENVETHDEVEEAQPHGEISRVYDSTFQIKSGESWRDLTLKAVAVNGTEPGKSAATRDMTYYEQLISYAADLGANCIRAKGLLPPEFYSALAKYDRTKKESPIYLIQTVPMPDGIEPGTQMTPAGREAWRSEIELVLGAVHGEIPRSDGRDAYFTDVSEYLLSVVCDPQIDGNTAAAMVANTSDFTFDGEYASGETGLAAFEAFLCDSIESISVERWGYHTCAAVKTPADMVKGTEYSDKRAYKSESVAKEAGKEYIYSDVVFDQRMIDRKEYKTMMPYDAYYAVFSELRVAIGDLVLSDVTFSDVAAVYSTPAMTEREQGDNIVTVLGAAYDARLLGAVVNDLNDDWSAVSEEMAPVTVPSANAHLWHNRCDPAQTTGLLAADGAAPTDIGLMLSDDDRVQRLQMYSNEEYMYITIQLLTDIDYKKETLFVGIDTFQRNEGEYYYSKEFTPNSLSGMEYVLRFDSKQEATLYVIPPYNRTGGKAFTEESYSGDFDVVSKLVYGGFSSGDNQFYQTGTTIFVRIPWTWLNVTDPSNRLVISDKEGGGVQMNTVTTNGALLSVMIGENETKDLMYAFPDDKRSPGYKVFKWETWEEASYTLRMKESFETVKNFFKSR